MDESLTGNLILVARYCRTLRARLLAERGIHPGQDVLLKLLADEDGQSMGAFARKLGVQPPTVTKMVNRMAAQGLVERRSDSADSRQCKLFITNTGSELVASIEASWRQAEDTVLANIKEKEQKRLRKILGKVLATFDQKLAEQIFPPKKSRETKSTAPGNHVSQEESLPVQD